MNTVIKEINYGIACRLGNTIYLHRGLRGHPELREALIQHELEHSSGYKAKDLFDDFGIKQLKDLKKEYYTFIIKHPSSLTEYLPTCRYSGKWIYSPTIALVWSFAIFIGWAVFKYVAYLLLVA